MQRDAPQNNIKTFFEIILIFLVAMAAGTTLAAFTLFYGIYSAHVSFANLKMILLDSLVLGSAFGFLWGLLYVFPVFILMRDFGFKVLLFSYLIVVVPSLTIEYFFGAFFLLYLFILWLFGTPVAIAFFISPSPRYR